MGVTSGIRGAHYGCRPSWAATPTSMRAVPFAHQTHATRVEEQPLPARSSPSQRPATRASQLPPPPARCQQWAAAGGRPPERRASRASPTPHRSAGTPWAPARRRVLKGRAAAGPTN